jgi:hypothetical protein
MRTPAMVQSVTMRNVRFPIPPGLPRRQLLCAATGIAPAGSDLYLAVPITDLRLLQASTGVLPAPRILLSAAIDFYLFDLDDHLHLHGAV